MIIYSRSGTKWCQEEKNPFSFFDSPAPRPAPAGVKSRLADIFGDDLPPPPVASTLDQDDLEDALEAELLRKARLKTNLPSLFGDELDRPSSPSPPPPARIPRQPVPMAVPSAIHPPFPATVAPTPKKVPNPIPPPLSTIDFTAPPTPILPPTVDDDDDDDEFFSEAPKPVVPDLSSLRVRVSHRRNFVFSSRNLNLNSLMLSNEQRSLNLNSKKRRKDLFQPRQS